MRIIDLVLLACSLSSALALADTVVVVSPHVDESAAKAQFAVAMEIFQEAPLNDTLTIIDGQSGDTVASLHVPDAPVLASGQGRINNNRAEIGNFIRFTKAASQGAHANGALNLPLVMTKLSRYFRKADDVVILGSVSFDVPELSADIVSGQSVLLDENLLRSSRESVFGTADISERLKGFRIHWLYTQALMPLHYQESAERFWHLWLYRQSADVISLSTDAKQVKKRLNKHAAPLEMPYSLNESQSSAVTLGGDLFQRGLSKTPFKQQLLAHKHQLRVGIRWLGDAVDMDIYASLAGNKDHVYFGNTTTAFAQHQKDVLHGASLEQDAYFETIVFTQPVKLCDVRLGVNHYSGKASGAIQGAIRIQVGEAVYERRFSFPNNDGNNGDDMNRYLRSGGESVYSRSYDLSDFTNEKVCQV